MSKGNLKLKKPKDIQSVKYGIEIYSNSTKPVRLQPQKTSENEMYGNSVTLTTIH